MTTLDHPALTPAADRVLDWAVRSRTADGFGALQTDGTVDPGLQTYLVARATHVLGLGVLLGRTELAPLVAHGVRSLRGPLADTAHGGWWTARPGHDAKQAYEHAFVVLAGATAAASGADGGRELLDDALHVWESRFWDESAGAAVDAYDAAFTRTDPYRGANANMHGVEAVLAAADVLGGEAAHRWRLRALRVTERFVHTEARGRSWRLPEHYDASWTADLEHGKDDPADPFRPYGVTVGHQFEWARLCVHLLVALGEQAPAWLLPDAEALYAAARDRGWRADGQDGFVYTLDWQDRPVVGARMHWVLTEALAAAAVLGAHTGRDAYREDAVRWTQHAQELFVDATTGCWHHELTPEGRLGEGTWTGQPDTYHVLQALLLPRLPVRASLAEAVLAARTGQERG